VELVIIVFVGALVLADLIARKNRGDEKGSPRGLTPGGLRICAMLLLLGTIITWTGGILRWGDGPQKIGAVLYTFIIPAAATVSVAAAAIVKFRKQQNQGC
jgi:hypothetical protein